MSAPWEKNWNQSKTSSGKPWEKNWRSPSSALEFKQAGEPLIEPLPEPKEKESEHGFFEDFGKSFLAGAVYDTGTAAYSILETISKPFSDEWTKTFRELADESAKMGRSLREEGKLWKGLGESGFDRGVDQDSWGSAIGSGAGSLTPLLAGGAALAAANVGRKVATKAVLGLVGLQSYGNTYQRARKGFEEQGMSEEEAAQKAMLPALQQGGLDIALTAVGGKVADKLGAFNIEKLAANLGSKNTKEAMDILIRGSGAREMAAKTGGRLGEVLKGGLIEGGIEEAPSAFIGEYIIARGSYDPNVTLEQASKEAWTSFVVGGALGVGMGAGSPRGRKSPEEAAKRETIRSVAPVTAAKLDERDAASLVLPDGEKAAPTAVDPEAEEIGTLEPYIIPLREKVIGEAFDTFKTDKRGRRIKDEAGNDVVDKKGARKPAWWNRYEGVTGPEGSTVPSGLRYADQETVNRFIEDQEAYEQLSEMSVKQDEEGNWEVSRKDEQVDVFETEQEARKAARESAIKAAPKQTQARIKRYQELTQKLAELEALDKSYQQQLEISQQQTAETEAVTAPENISVEDQSFVAEKLGISVDDLKYSGLNITQEMVDQLRFAPEGAGIRQFLNAAEKIRKESPETPFSPLGEVRRVQDEAAKRAEEINAERNEKALEAELVAASIAADRIKADIEMRTELEDEAEISPALRKPTRPTEPRTSQRFGQFVEEELESPSTDAINPTTRPILNRLLDRKANLVADSYGIKDEQQIDNFIQSINQIDQQIASILEEPPPSPVTPSELSSMQSLYGDIDVNVSVEEEAAAMEGPEPITTLKVGDVDIKVTDRTGGVDGVANAAAPSVTGAQMQPTILKNINVALERISKRFGTLLDLSEIRLVRLKGGAGVASIARTGVTDAILVDVDRIAKSMSNKKFSLEKALEEELIHNLDGQALFAEYARLITSGQLSPAVDIRSFIEQRYTDIYNNMTAAERAAARELYGNDFIDNVHLAQEFVRQLVQKRHTRSTTEEAYRSRPIKKLLEMLRSMFSRKGLSEPLRKHIANIESFLERTYKLESKEASDAETKKQLKEERAERKKLIGKKAADQEVAYLRTAKAVLSLSQTEGGKWLSSERGQDYGAKIVDEVYDAWRKRYKSDEVFRKSDVPSEAWFKAIAKRRAANLAQAEFGTKKRGAEIEFSSFEAARETYGLDPADSRPATEIGERFISVVKEMNYAINLNQTQLVTFEARLRNYSNPEVAKMLGIAETSASSSFTKAIESIAEAARGNSNIKNAFVDAAQDPNFFIDATSVAYAADPTIRKERIAGLVEAQRKYQNSKKTRAEWNELNNAVEKFKAIARDYPQPTQESLLSREQIIAALKEDSAKKAADYFSRKDKGQTLDGNVIDVRIDIPAYLKTLKEKGKGDYVVTFHPQNKGTVIGYDSFVHLAGFGDTGLVEFVEGKDKKKINIATDVEGQQGRKTSFARVRGSVASTTDIPDVTGPEWTQVGFDPERHSYFYNRANPTMRVTSGTEAVSIGNTVFVRNAEMEDAFEAGVAYSAEPHMASDPDKKFASRILDKLGDFKKRLFRAFSSDGGLIMPSAINGDKQLNFFQPKINKDAYINSVLGEVRGENRRLKKAVEKELGEPTEKDVATMNSALNGNLEALEQLTPEVRETILTMRTQIDALSGYIVKKGWVTGSLKGTIDKNIGTYLARSYRIFDEKGYAENIEPEIFNQAINFVEQQLIKQGKAPSEAQQEAIARVNEMLQKYSQDNARDMFDRGKLGEKDLSLFMKRKDIAPEIRALLGEYTDPVINYSRSINRLAHFVGNHQFLTDLKKIGMNEVFFDAKDFEGRNNAEANTLIPGMVAGVKVKEGEEDASRGSYSPLAGLYTTKEVASLLENYDSISKVTEVFGVGFLIRLNVFTKSMKTVASVMTHVRNLLGQPYFLLMNGHNPFAYKKAKTAIKAIWADAAGNSQSAQAYFNKMTRLGLVGEEMTTAELARVLGKHVGEIDSADSAQGLLDKGLGKMATAWGAMVRTYRASDEIGKIMNFEMEKEALRPIRPDATEAQLEAEAAERTRGGIPTYSMLPPTVQTLRMQPFVGPFMSFFYEAGRTQVMNIKYAMQELKGGTAAHRAYASRRIVGHFASTIGLGVLLQAASKLSFGISDEEEEGFREFLPEWEKDSQFIMWRDDNGQLQYINISYNNPYSSTTDKLLAMAFLSGKPEETVAKNITSKTIEMLRPFTSETIAAQAALNLLRNKDQYGNKIRNEQADWGDQFADAFEHGAKALTPATIERAWNKWRPAYLGKHLPKSARVPKLGDELLAEVTGFRIRTLDYEDAILQSSFASAANISEANYIFNRTAGRGGVVTKAEMLDDYKKANEARYRNFQQMAKKVQAALRGGLKRSQIINAMKVAKMSSKDSGHILNLNFRPMTPSPQIIRKAKDKGHPIPIREINEIRRAWIQKPLFENGE